MDNKTRIAVRELSQCYRFEYPYIIPIKTADGRPLKKPFLPTICKTGYPIVSFRRRKQNISMKVQVHQIVAYQKYGEQIFQEKIMCRHLDNDKTNFRESNIMLGTSKDNYLDNPPALKEKLKKVVVQSAKKRRIFNGDEVKEILSMRKEGATYREITAIYKASKSTVSYLCTGKTYKEYTNNNLGAWVSELNQYGANVPIS